MYLKSQARFGKKVNLKPISSALSVDLEEILSVNGRILVTFKVMWTKLENSGKLFNQIFSALLGSGQASQIKSFGIIQYVGKMNTLWEDNVRFN